MHFPDCFYFHVIQGQGIIHDFFWKQIKIVNKDKIAFALNLMG